MARRIDELKVNGLSMRITLRGGGARTLRRRAARPET